MSVREMWRTWALVIVAGVLAWLLLQDATAPEVPVVAAVHPGARLPPLPPPPRPVDPAAALAALSHSTLWGPLAARAGSGASGPDAEPPPPKWNLSGYFSRDGSRFVVVSFERLARPSQNLTVGDKLPDGSRIVRIEPDRVRVQPASIDSPQEGASAPGSGWLPITPGLPEIARNNKR